jgi:putative redox protein
MAVEVDIVYEGNLRCIPTHGPSRDSIATDAPVDNGGRGAAFSPTDLVATALGTCVVTIMAQAAKRIDVNIDGTRVHVTKEMTRSGLRRIAELKVRISVAGGAQLSPAQRERLEIAADTCPVKKSLHPDVNVAIEFSYD